MAFEGDSALCHTDSPRDRLADRVGGFPRRIAAARRRAWLLQCVIRLLVIAGMQFILSKLVKFATWIATQPVRLAVYAEWLLFGLLVFMWLWLMYKLYRRNSLFMSIVDHFYPYRGHRVQRGVYARVIALLRAGQPYGVYLRGFQDEHGLVPASRQVISRALGESAGMPPFIAVDNAYRGSFTPDELLVLPVPPEVWKETVFALIECASVIVVDLTAGVLHWMLPELPDDLHGIEREVEFSRRGGLVDEMEMILTRGYAQKMVTFMPGWRQARESGKAEEMIRREKRITAERGSLERKLAGESGGEELFTRTRIKLALMKSPRVADDENEVCEHVRQVLASA